MINKGILSFYEFQKFVHTVFQFVLILILPRNIFKICELSTKIDYEWVLSPFQESHFTGYFADIFNLEAEWNSLSNCKSLLQVSWICWRKKEILIVLFFSFRGTCTWYLVPWYVCLHKSTGSWIVKKTNCKYLESVEGRRRKFWFSFFLFPVRVPAALMMLQRRRT